MKKFFKQLFFVCISMIGLTASTEITASDIFQKGLDCAQKGQYEQAAKYFQRAAEQGDAFAQCNLGSYYESGTGVSNTLLVPISNNTILPFASSMIFDGFTSRCNIFVDLIDCGDNSDFTSRFISSCAKSQTTLLISNILTNKAPKKHPPSPPSPHYS